MSVPPAEAGPCALRLTVAVLTYLRPAHLAEVLPLLSDQVADVADRVAAARVLVVDNSPQGSARGQVDAVARTLAGSVAYVHEPRPGIPAARNRALDSSGDDDLLVFVDDDERPAPGWLGALLDRFAAERPAAVVGAVVPRYEVPPPPFVVAGRFFERRRFTSGTCVPAAATSNLLLDLRVVRRWGLRFDEGLGLTGADDTYFTRYLVRRGERIVWCDEAVVVDVVPAARARVGWVLLRAVRSGNTWAIVSVRLAGTTVERATARTAALGAGLARVAGGALVALLSLRGSPARRAHALRTVCRGVGLLLGAVGVAYVEYQRPDAGHLRLRPVRSLGTA
ncbi:glycosyltransferase family 2 protein [Thalassiella azotivora]